MFIQLCKYVQRYALDHFGAAALFPECSVFFDRKDGDVIGEAVGAEQPVFEAVYIAGMLSAAGNDLFYRECFGIDSSDDILGAGRDIQSLFIFGKTDRSPVCDRFSADRKNADRCHDGPCLRIDLEQFVAQFAA